MGLRMTVRQGEAGVCVVCGMSPMPVAVELDGRLAHPGCAVDVPDIDLELEAVVVAREAQAEMLKRVVSVLRRLPSKGKYAPDQIIAIVMREFGGDDG